MNTIKDLVGYQLISIDASHIVVKKGYKKYVLEIEDECGGCCGFNNINTQLLVSAEELNRNPIITNVTMENEDADDYYYGDAMRVTFFGEAKPLAELCSFSSSGSGWGYGACVTIKCKALRLEEVITSW